MLSSYSNISLDKVEAVLIDIDDTLYSYKNTHPIALKSCYNLFLKHNPKPNDISENQFKHIYRQKRSDVTKRLHPQGVCRSRFFAFQAVFEEWNIQQAYSLALVFEKHYWQTLIKNIQVSTQAEIFLSKCHAQKIKVCAISDMQASFQVQKLKAMNLEKYIDFLVTSEEVGVEKPHKKMFQSALNKLNTPADKAIMIGDSFEKDILGAQQLNIKAYHIKL